MFQRFTQTARAVVAEAVRCAEDRGDRHVGTEHLLLGVAATNVPVAASSLRGVGVTSERARSSLDALDAQALAAVGVETSVPVSSADVPRTPRRRRGLRSQIPFTDGAKSCLENSLVQAEAVGDRHIGAEHIVLALSRTGLRDPARLLLAALDVEQDELFNETVARIEAGHREAS